MMMMMMRMMMMIEEIRKGFSCLMIVVCRKKLGEPDTKLST